MDYSWSCDPTKIWRHKLGATSTSHTRASTANSMQSSKLAGASRLMEQIFRRVLNVRCAAREKMIHKKLTKIVRVCVGFFVDFLRAARALRVHHTQRTAGQMFAKCRMTSYKLIRYNISAKNVLRNTKLKNPFSIVVRISSTDSKIDRKAPPYSWVLVYHCECRKRLVRTTSAKYQVDINIKGPASLASCCSAAG